MTSLHRVYCDFRLSDTDKHTYTHKRSPVSAQFCTCLVKKISMGIDSLKLCYYYFNQAISPQVPHDTDWPTFYIKNGETAEIPCTSHLEADAYFWRKGKTYNVSKGIAYNTRGFSTNSTKYRVLSDGYLTIKDFSTSDQGRYFCRRLSDTNECYSMVNIYLKGKHFLQCLFNSIFKNFKFQSLNHSYHHLKTLLYKDGFFKCKTF